MCCRVSRSASFLKAEAGFLTQTHDQPDGRGITDITIPVNSVNSTTAAPL